MNRTGASATAELVPHCLALPTTWSFSTRTRFPCVRSWPFLAFGTIYGQILEFPIRRGPRRALGALGSIFALVREAALNPGALSSLPRSANRHLSFFFGFSWCWFFFVILRSTTNCCNKLPVSWQITLCSSGFGHMCASGGRSWRGWGLSCPAQC